MVNVVTAYVDGVGNHVNAIQWDGTQETFANIALWTRKASLNRHGVLGIQMPTHIANVAPTQWLAMDSNHLDQVFPITNGQFIATYKPAAAGAVVVGEVITPTSPL